MDWKQVVIVLDVRARCTDVTHNLVPYVLACKPIIFFAKFWPTSYIWDPVLSLEWLKVDTPSLICRITSIWLNVWLVKMHKLPVIHSIRAFYANFCLFWYDTSCLLNVSTFLSLSACKMWCCGLWFHKKWVILQTLKSCNIINLAV